MCKKTIWLVSLALAFGLASTGFSATVSVGDFESGLDGWFTDQWVVGTVSLSTTGATSGTQAMLVEGPGGWQNLCKMNAKLHMEVLAKRGVTITADVTAFAADMTTTWMQVGTVINAQSNDNNGANNNLGWNQFDALDVPIDGQPHTLTWVLPDDLTDKIAGADDSIGWFELQLLSNLDSASVAKFYVDNIQLSYEEPTSSMLIGDFEGVLEGWELAPDTPAASTLEFSTQGVTSGTQSLKVTIPEGGWKNAIRLNVNAQGLTQEFEKNHEFSIDITRLAADWTGQPADGHSGIHFIINAGGDGWSIWHQGDYMGWWKWDQGDQTQTLTWDYSSALPQMQFDNIWWLELWIISNYDAAYTTGGVYYLDNAQLSGAPIETTKSSDVVIANWEQSMDGWVAGGGADVLFNDHNGVTLGDYSLDVFLPNGGGWQDSILQLDVVAAGLVDVLKANTKISVDITRLVADWPTDVTPNWNEIVMVIQAGGDGWDASWIQLPVRAGWRQTDGDQTVTATWDYGTRMSEMNYLEGLTWMTLRIVSNVNSDYTGWSWFYLDNLRLSGGGLPLEPQPANGTADVPIDSKLSWKAGAFATTHHLYLGTDRVKVTNADMDSDPDVTFVVLDEPSFDPNGLEFKTQYFWRVDEVNEANPDSPWLSPVWNFTTANFVVVEDLESYNDINPGEPGSNRIMETLIDGYDVETNGALVGHPFPPYAEQTTVRNGTQALPLYYDNTGAALQSEVQRVWVEPQDWTVNGFNSLKLYTYGVAQNVPGELYVIVEDNAGVSHKVVNPDSALFTTEEWKEWTASLDEVAAAGVNTAAITKLVIGIADLAGQAEASGILYIDDIRVGFQPIGLVAHYAFENNLDDSSGNGHHGTLEGDPNYPAQYVAGPTGLGQAMLFDGSMSGHQFVELGTFNPSAATDQLSIALWAKWDGPSDYWQSLIAKRHSGDWDRNIMMWYFELERNAWDVRFYREGSGVATGQLLQVGQWTHLAVTFDGTTAKIYINGALVDEGSFSFGNDTEAPMQIGATSEGGGNPFNGAIDEVYIYDIALSEAEILQLAGR